MERLRAKLLRLVCFLRSLKPEETVFIYLYILGGYLACGVPVESFRMYFSMFLFIFSIKTIYEFSIPTSAETTTFFAFRADNSLTAREKKVFFIILTVLFFLSGWILSKTFWQVLLLFFVVVWMLGRITTVKLRQLLTRSLVCALLVGIIYLPVNGKYFLEIFLLVLGIGSWWFGLAVFDLTSSLIHSESDFYYRGIKILAGIALAVSILSWLAFARQLNVGIIFSIGLTVVAAVLLGLVSIFPGLPEKVNLDLFNFCSSIIFSTFFLLMLFDFAFYR